MQLDVAELTSDTVALALGWSADSSPTTTSTTVSEERDRIHHLPSSVESTLASLPYDDLYFPPCIDGAFDDDSPISAPVSFEL